MLHKVCQKFLCNLHKGETTACAFVYGPANDGGVEAFPVQWSRKSLSYLSIFSQIKMKSLAYGGCISGKNFFRLVNLFCSGHNNPGALFRFRITKTTYPLFLREKNKVGPIPTLFFLITNFFLSLWRFFSPHQHIHSLSCTISCFAFTIFC